MSKKLQIFLCLSLVLTCLLFLAGCEEPDVIKKEEKTTDRAVIIFDDSERPDPEDTILRIIQLLQSDDSRQIFKEVYPLALERYGEEQIVDRNAKIHTDLGVKSIVYSNLQILEESSNKSQVYYSVDVKYTTKYGEIKDNIVISLVWHPQVNSWQLDWTPDLILPKLHDTGQVKIEILKAKRGEILDRAGWPLAIDKTIAEVSLVAGEFDEARIPEVNELFGLSPGLIEAKLSQAWVTDRTLVPFYQLGDLKDIDYRVFQDLRLSWSEKTSRYYPFKEALAPLVGYVGPVTAEDLSKPENRYLAEDSLIGKSGLEQIYDELLRGKDGFRIYISGSYEQSLIEEPAQDGQDLRLTIDAIAQRDIYEILAGKNYSATAIDPATGEIIILISSPAYDPMEFVMGIDYDRYNQLLHDPLQPLIAKFQGAHTPGSTQKIPTAIIALANGAVTPSTELEILGKEWQADPAWGNYYVRRYRELDGIYNLEDALVYSDNIFFARIALEMGIDAFNQGMSNLGVGLKISSDYPFASSQISNKTKLEEGDDILLADSSYGQGELLYNQAHLASVFSSLLNEGQLLPAKLVLESRDDLASESEDLEEEKSGLKLDSSVVQKHKILSKDYIPLLQRASERVVDEQYAREMLRGPVQPAGKSGTAEVGFDEFGEVKIDTWFVGYERNNPNLLLAFTLFDSPNDFDFAGHVYFTDILLQLYGDDIYKIPTNNLSARHLPNDIPSFKKSRALTKAQAEWLDLKEGLTNDLEDSLDGSNRADSDNNGN